MGVGIDMVDAAGVEGAGAPNQAMDLIALEEEQFGQIRAVLASDAGNKRPHGSLRIG
jgi:hypothetical protein